MKYQLNLDSTNYYSSETGANIHTHRVYAVDWSFLPENKKFIMTFKFQTLRRTASGYNASTMVIRVRCSFGGPFQQNINGKSNASKTNSDFIGLVVTKRASNATNDQLIRIMPYHNPPTFLPARPTSNFLTIETINNNDTRNVGITGSYLMTLFFEEIDD